MKGNITVFFSIIFTVIVALICTVTESARMYVASVRAYSTTCMATESQFAEYSKEAFSDYGVLLLWEKDIEKNVAKYINSNISNNKKMDLYKLSLEDVENTYYTYCTDNGGDLYVKQILQYEKYAVVEDVISNLLEYLDLYNNLPQIKADKEEDKFEDIKSIFLSDEDIALLQQMSRNYDEKVKIIKLHKSEMEEWSRSLANMEEEIINNSSEDKSNIKTDDNNDFSKKEISKQMEKKMKKELQRLRKELNILEKSLNETLIVANVYAQKKKEILSKYSYDEKTLGEDYIEQEALELESMIIILKNISDEMINDVIESIDEKGLMTRGQASDCLKNIYKELEILNSDIGNLKNAQNESDDGQSVEIFNNAKKLLEKGLLEMVMPEDLEVSSKSLIMSDMPSQIDEYSKISRENPLENMVNKALFVHYISENYSCCTDGLDTDLSNQSINYQMEYILQGKPSDKENLSDTVVELAGIRQIFNTVKVLRDTTKMTEIDTVATSVAVYFGLGFIQPIVKAILVEATALTYTVEDVKNLLKGERVELIEIYNAGNESRTISKDEVINVDDNKNKVNENNEVNKNNKVNEKNILGLTYKNYLQLLLLIHDNENVVYRTMDVTQAEIMKKYNSEFKLSECIVYAKLEAQFYISALFTKLPIATPFINNEIIQGKFKTVAEYKYIQ